MATALGPWSWARRQNAGGLIYIRLQPALGKARERRSPRVLGLDLGQDPSCLGNRGAKRSPTDPVSHLHLVVGCHTRSGGKLRAVRRLTTA